MVWNIGQSIIVYSVSVSQASYALVGLGTKFPSKSLEMHMNATVYFSDHLPGQSSSGDDPFCVGLNAYIEVSSVHI